MNLDNDDRTLIDRVIANPDANYPRWVKCIGGNWVDGERLNVWEFEARSDEPEFGLTIRLSGGFSCVIPLEKIGSTFLAIARDMMDQPEE